MSARENVYMCPLTKGKTYESAETMKKDWTLRQMEDDCNAHFVDADVTLATPYMYEDVAPTEVLDQLPESCFINQSYLLTTYNTDGTVAQRILPTIAGAFTEASFKSEVTAKMPTEGTFKITLEDLDSGETASVQGDMPYNVVSLDNVQNAHAERMAGTAAMCKGAMKPFAKGLQQRAKYSTVLWPNPRAVKEAFKDIAINKDSLYDITIESSTLQEPMTQTFRFLLDKSPLEMAPVQRKQLAQSKLGRFYTTMIKNAANAGNVEIALDKASTYNLQMPDGSTVKLTVEMRTDDSGRMLPYLVNVEVMQGYNHYGGGRRLPRYNRTPGPTPRVVYKGSGGVNTPYVHKIECDTSKVEHVGGLYMALKDRVEDYADVLDVMKAANKNPSCSLIHELDAKHKEYQKQLRSLESYYEKLHAEGPVAEKNNPQINMLVSSIMEDQYQYIGAKMKQENYMAKILKDGAGAGDALADELIERYKSAQESVRQADEDITVSKRKAAKGGAGVKIKETARRVVLKAKKGAAVVKKRAAEAAIRDLIAALLDAQGSPLVNNETSTVVNELDTVITKLRGSKSRTGGTASERGAPQDDDDMSQTDTQADEWDGNYDDSYSSYGGRGKTNWAY